MSTTENHPSSISMMTRLDDDITINLMPFVTDHFHSGSVRPQAGDWGLRAAGQALHSSNHRLPGATLNLCRGELNDFYENIRNLKGTVEVLIGSFRRMSQLGPTEKSNFMCLGITDQLLFNSQYRYACSIHQYRATRSLRCLSCSIGFVHRA